MPQAPVANMMGGSATPNVNPFSRPPSSHQSPPAFAQSTPSLRVATEDACDPVVAKYPYLYAAHKQRPKVYQSPFISEGGFTTHYLPNAVKRLTEPLKVPSLSEDFLMKRTVSQQEILRNHKRQISDDKLRHQNDQHQSIVPKQTSQTMAPPPSHTSFHPLQQTTQPPFYPPQNFQYEYPPPPPLHPDPQSSVFNPTSCTLTLQQQQAGLQFQSPHDFQMQMQREAQQHEWARAQQSGYDHFFRGLHSAATHGHEGHIEVGRAITVTGPTQGSPLKYELESGGEMLPMMGDRF